MDSLTAPNGDRAGLATPNRSWWVQSEHEAQLRGLVATVSAAA